MKKSAEDLLPVFEAPGKREEKDGEYKEAGGKNPAESF